MQQIFFYIFSALTLLCAALVIYNPLTRNPVTSAMFLFLTIVSMAGLFVLLHAFFLAAVQVLVYAGAVMVLFIFVIMLLDLKEEEHRHLKAVASALGLIAVGVIALVMIATIRQSRVGFTLHHNLAEGSTTALGRYLFIRAALPFEVVSLLLLAAMIGTVLLSKKDLR